MSAPASHTPSLTSCCAGFYELPVAKLLLGETYHPGGTKLTRQLAESTLVGPGTRVLDLASGEGVTVRLVAEELGADATGVDVSEKNVEAARQQAEAAGLADRARFEVADVGALPFDDGSFDVVLCECALCTFPDANRALAEARRVLKPRGRIGISDIVLNKPIPEPLQGVLGHVLCLAGARSDTQTGELIESAGFTSLRTRDATTEMLALVDRIEAQFGRADLLQSALGDDLPGWLEASGPVIAEAQQYIRGGGAGYALFTARRTGT